MDRRQIENEHIVARYLADQLSPEEAEAFEAYYTQHPSMVREIEYALRLKEGLATLEDRGQLEELVRQRRWRWATPLSLAAAVAVAAFGAWMWQSSNRAPTLAGSLDGLAAGMTAPLPISGKYLLVRVRGTPAPLEIPLPQSRGAIELQLLPTGGAAGAPYTLALSHVDESGDTDAMARITGLTPGPDGLVTAWLDSAALRPGRHALTLTSGQSANESTSDAPADRFVIQLR